MVLIWHVGFTHQCCLVLNVEVNRDSVQNRATKITKSDIAMGEPWAPVHPESTYAS